jgi:hypothetical protein
LRLSSNFLEYDMMTRRTSARATLKVGFCACLALVLAGARPALAGTVVFEGTGWQAQWDASLDGLVDVDFIDVIGDTIFIQKAAEFTQPPTNNTHTPVVISFQQTGPSTISSIVIDDEIVTNSTGVAWTGFVMSVNNAPGGGVSFNPVMTAGSGGGGPIGFSIDPFTTAEFVDGDRRLNISGGVLADDEIWFPGGGGNDGQLWINVQSGPEGDFSSFSFSEQPVSEVIGAPPVCVEILPPDREPDCGSSNNVLNAVTNNVTITTTQDWEVVSGPCVIQTEDGPTMTYSIPDTCPTESCCLFRFTVDEPGDAVPPSICEREVCCECPGEEELACRVTGGGNDKSVDHALNPEGGLNRYTWGGQVGAPTAAQPQPFGEWTHRQHRGPAGKWTFHAGTASAPDETEIDLVTCCDPGFCNPARPAPAHQINFEGVGVFKNGTNLPPGVRTRGSNRTFHWFTVHIEDAGEPGSHGLPNGDCPEEGFNCAPLDCACPDFYHITIYAGVKRGQSPNTTEKIYEVFGYINGGNFQIHPPIGDVNSDQEVNAADLDIVLRNLGTSGPGDVDGNRLVDVVDASLVLDHWGDWW